VESYGPKGIGSVQKRGGFKEITSAIDLAEFNLGY
jgi:hypothetical protein